MTDPESTDEEPAITARGLAVTGPWGPVFGPVDLDIDAGGVTVLVGSPGAGRTALLMTLAGRMKPAAGTLTVFGRSRPTEIFGHSALAGIDELDNVFESVTVRDLITEQLRWDASWYRLVRRAGARELAEVCAPVFGPLPLPPLTEYVDALTELDGLLLRIALANTARPDLLVVGSIDQVTTTAHRMQLLRRLVELGARQTVVTTTANRLPAEDAADLGLQAQLNVDRLNLAEPKGAE